MQYTLTEPRRAVLSRILGLLLLGFVLSAVFTVAFAPAARAADGGGITFDVSWPLIIGLLVSTILPLVVGLVTKYTTAPGVRAVLLAALAALTGLLSELGAALTAGTTYNVGTGLLVALTAFLVATGMHFGLYKPTGISDAAKAVGSEGGVR